MGWLELSISLLQSRKLGLPRWFSAGDAGDAGSNPGSGRSQGGGHGNSLQYSCLGNPMDGGDWLAQVHRFTKSRTGVSYGAPRQVKGYSWLGLGIALPPAYLGTIPEVWIRLN